jgi:hypothetical protein
LRRKQGFKIHGIIAAAARLTTIFSDHPEECSRAAIHISWSRGKITVELLAAKKFHLMGSPDLAL